MGEGRRRELTIGCREYSFDYCNSSISKSISFLLAGFIGLIQFLRNLRFLN